MIQSSAKLQLKWADGEQKRVGLAGVDPRCANKLFVTNIPHEATQKDLVTLFSHYGDIQLLYLIKDPKNSENNRCYLKYLTKEMALLCIKALNRTYKLHDYHKPLEVMFVEQKRAIRAMSMYAPQETELGQTIYYEYMSEEGIPYYFNPKTSTAQWERPTDAVVQPPPLFDGSLPAENTGRVNTTAAASQAQMTNPQMDPYGMMQGYGMMPQYGVMGHPQYMAAMDPAMMQNQMMHGVPMMGQGMPAAGVQPGQGANGMPQYMPPVGFL